MNKNPSSPPAGELEIEEVSSSLSSPGGGATWPGPQSHEQHCVATSVMVTDTSTMVAGEGSSARCLKRQILMKLLALFDLIFFVYIPIPVRSIY